MERPEYPRDLHVRVALMEQAHMYAEERARQTGEQVSRQHAYQMAQHLWSFELQSYLRDQQRTVEVLSKRLEEQAAQGAYLRYGMAAVLVMAVATNPTPGVWEKIPGIIKLLMP